MTLIISSNGNIGAMIDALAAHYQAEALK